MSHSTHVGFNAPLVGETTIERFSCFPMRARLWIEDIERFPRSRLSSAWGVGQYRSPARVSGVGKNPGPIADMWGTNGCRWYAVPFRVIPERGQVTKDLAHCSSFVDGKEVCDVLHEDESGS